MPGAAVNNNTHIVSFMQNNNNNMNINNSNNNFAIGISLTGN